MTLSNVLLTLKTSSRYHINTKYLSHSYVAYADGLARLLNTFLFGFYTASYHFFRSDIRIHVE